MEVLTVSSGRHACSERVLSSIGSDTRLVDKPVKPRSGPFVRGFALSTRAPRYPFGPADLDVLGRGYAELLCPSTLHHLGV